MTDDNGNTVSYLEYSADEETCITYPVVTSPAPNCANAPSSTNTVVDRSYDNDGRLAWSTAGW